MPIPLIAAAGSAIAPTLAQQWTQLKGFELKNQENLLAYLQTAGAQNVELEQIHQKDRESARGMQMDG